jgi:SAM-dependent methyltransferase
MHGDFLQLDLPGPFDFILSSDSLAPMSSYQACIDRIAKLLRPGGILLLMTQNPFVWTRKSTLIGAPDGVPHASPKQWPTLRSLRGLLRPCFSIVDVMTICPGGDRGLLWWVENGAVERNCAWLFGQYRWRRILEIARLGRELVIIGRRRSY